MGCAELAEAVFRLAAERHERMTRIDHRLHHTGIATLCGDAVELLVHGDRVGCRLLRDAVVPLADDFHHVPLLARGSEHFLDAVVTIGVHRGAGHAAHFEDLAAIGHLVDQPMTPEFAEALLVDVDVDRVLGVENVVEGDKDHAGILGALDHGCEGLRVLGVDDDRVVAGIDEVVDRRDLRGHIFAGRDDLEFLQQCRDFRLCCVGFGRLDHLDAPGVGDIAVGESHPERAGLGRELEELGVFGPRHVAGGVVGRAGHDLGSCGLHRRCAERQKECCSGTRYAIQKHI